MRKKYAIFSLLVILISLVEINSVFLKCDDMTSVVSVAFDPNTKDYANEAAVIDLVVQAIQQGVLRDILLHQQTLFVLRVLWTGNRGTHADCCS